MIQVHVPNGIITKLDENIYKANGAAGQRVGNEGNGAIIHHFASA